MSDTSFAQYCHYGTNAQRLAFTPSPGGGQPIYSWYETDTGNLYIYDTSWHLIVASSGITALTGQVTASGSGSVVATIAKPYIPFTNNELRLTTESGVPVSTSDRTAQGTIYLTPYLGNQIGIYSGSAWIMFNQAELSLALTVTSGKNYDVFIDYNSGTPQLALSAAWTNDTTRADALARQDGIWVKSGTTTLRWVGTIRASGSNVTADSGGVAGTSQTGGQRYIWNAYNQVIRPNKVIDTTDTWSYNTGTWRQANGASGNKIEWVSGDASLNIYAVVRSGILDFSNSARSSRTGVGIDSTTAAPIGLWDEIYNPTTGGIVWNFGGIYNGAPGLGYHFATWMEFGGDGTVTWYGDGGGTVQRGLTAWMLG